MKTKILCLFLSILFILTLTACGTNPADSTLDPALMNGEFTVTGEIYTYRGKNVLVLNAKNGTDTNYTVTIHVTYLDENGEALKSQKQTFDAFSSGGQKYFFFNPNLAFSSYTCTVEKTEYEGECYLHYVTTGGLWEKPFIYKDVSENKEWITASWILNSAYTHDLYIACTYLIITEEGELYFQDSRENNNILCVGEGTVDKTVKTGRLNTLTLPEELEGDILGICVIRKLSNEPLVSMQPPQ